VPAHELEYEPQEFRITRQKRVFIGGPGDEIIG
jgi:hypothetical protein